jgi:hypothetical protein
MQYHVVWYACINISEKLRALVFKAEHVFHMQQFFKPLVPIEKTAWCHILHSWLYSVISNYAEVCKTVVQYSFNENP